MGKPGIRKRIGCIALIAALSLFGFACGSKAETPPLLAPRTIAGSAATETLLDINTATVEQLSALPGFGEAYAQRIIAGRPYTAKNQIVTRGIIPAEAYQKVKGLIIAHRLKP